MSKKHQKQTLRALGWIKNENFYASEPSDGQKTRNSTLPSPRRSKTVHGFCRNRRWEAKPATGFIKKRKKLRIPWTESSKNGKNCKFRGRNHQKSLKTANSVGRIIKKRKKVAFPTLGKIKITRFLPFPTLGKAKTPQGDSYKRRSSSGTCLGSPPTPAFLLNNIK